jgi:Na+/H+ antiporter NhaC
MKRKKQSPRATGKGYVYVPVLCLVYLMLSLTGVFGPSLTTSAVTLPQDNNSTLISKINNQPDTKSANKKGITLSDNKDLQKETETGKTVEEAAPGAAPQTPPTEPSATVQEDTEHQKASETKTPKFNLPTIVFKGETLKKEKIGGYDRLYINGKAMTGESYVIKSTGNIEIKIEAGDQVFSHSLYSVNGWVTILPPLVAIALALIFKDVVVALFIGIFTGALFIHRFDVFGAFFRVIDKYILEAVSDSERASIIMFTMLLGGMVGVISKSGGVKGIVDSLSKKVQSARGTQFYTWLMGILIFFDDYTNTLVVGNTMRPLSDRWKVSREKLAYIVDSTAAPIASIALISTWIGFEISLINQSLKAYNVDFDAYHLFLSSLPYRFYPLLALIFVLLIFTLRRDFGPMLKAENRARAGKIMRDKAVPLSDFESSALTPAKFIPARWYNGLVPIIVVIVGTFVGLYISGKAGLAGDNTPLAARSFFEIIFSGNFFKDLGSIVSSADSFKVLLWASLLGVCTAFLMAWTQRILKLRDLVTALVQGMKSMMMAIIILVLAWSLGVVLTELKTADFLVSLISSTLDYQLFPAIVFVFSGFIAFSTGTSWGTIAIMYPLVIPIIIALTKHTADFKQFLVLTIASVLAGAVFGDHCSPISDTTIMSSMASSCDHIDHVKTQIPYALLMAFTAVAFGILPVSFGFPYIISILASVGFAVVILLVLGKKVREEH